MVSICFVEDPGNDFRQSSPDFRSVEEDPFYTLWTWDISCRTPQCITVVKHRILDQLTENCRMVRNPCNMMLYAVALHLNRMCELAVTHSILTSSQLYIPQDFRLPLVIIFLKSFATVNQGSTHTSAWCEWIWIEPNDRRIIKQATCWDTLAMHIQLSLLERC